MSELQRCQWVDLQDPLYVEYHDQQWGVPVHDDRLLFEMLCLEGAQAGLAWITILRKRANYQKAFDNFQPQKVAAYQEAKVSQLLQNRGIVRNRRKVESCIKNAQVFCRIQKKYGSFDRYLWSWVNFKPIDGQRDSHRQVPTWTPLAKEVSADLKQKGMSFVGPTIVYSFLQAVGVVNDHLRDCFCYQKVKLLT